MTLVKKNHAAKMYKQALKRGISHEEVKFMLMEKYGIDTSWKLTGDQCAEVRKLIQTFPLLSAEPIKRKKKKFRIADRK